MYSSDPLPDYRYWQGRETELNHLFQWFKDPSVSIIGIWGEAGIGKSTLAAKAFSEIRGFQGKCWIDMLTETSPGDIVRRALQEFGVPPKQIASIPEDQLLKQCLHHLQKQPYLLAIDNIEALLTPEGQWRTREFEDFLTHFQYFGSRSVILLTGQEYPPTYYAWRNSKWLFLEDGLSPDAGAALLTALGATGSVQEQMAVSNQVKGHPFALSAIADWLRSRDRHNPHMQYLKELGSLTQIIGLHRTKPNINLEEIFNQGFQRLSPESRETLTRLTVLQQNFTDKAATDVAGRPVSTDDLRDMDRRALLQELSTSDQSGHKQFRLLPCIRDRLQQRLNESDKQSAHEGAIKYYRAIAKRSGWKTLEDFDENLEIVHHCCQLNQYAQAFNELWNEKKENSLDQFLKSHSHNLYRVKLYTFLDDQWQTHLYPEDRIHYATLHNCLGSAYEALGQYENARKSYKLVVSNFDPKTDAVGVAEAWLGLGAVDHLTAQNDTAVGWYRKVLDIYQKLAYVSPANPKYSEGLANAWIGLSKIDYAKQQYADAIGKIYQEVIPRFEQLNDLAGQAKAWNVLGYVNQGLKNFDQAIYWHQRALATFKDIEDRLGQADAQNGLGASYLALKDYKNAGSFYQKALAISQEIGHEGYLAKASQGLSELSKVQTTETDQNFV